VVFATNSAIDEDDSTEPGLGLQVFGYPDSRGGCDDRAGDH
jgi:hypothetical protein